MNEKTNPANRREWVKNAAIIFLSVMLVLTFFSNTIMNYSLPEVATEYVQSGTITEKVRGTGTLEATDPYNIVVKDTRKIESVNVKDGDVVEKDAVLFYLEEVESDELKTAQKELDELRIAYLTGLFTGDITSDAISKVESGKTGSLASYQAQLAAIDSKIEAAKNRLESATVNQQNTQSVLNNLTGQQKIDDAQVVDTTNEEKTVNSATANVARAQETVNSLKTQIEGVNAKIAEATALLGTPDPATGSLQGGLTAYQDAKTNAENDVAAANVQLEAAKAKLSAAEASGDADAIAQAQTELNEIQIYIVNAAEEKLKVATSELENAINILKLYDVKIAELAGLEQSLETANADLVNANNSLASATEALNNKKLSGNNTSAKADMVKQVVQAETNSANAGTEVETATAELKKLEEEKSRLVKSITSELDLDAKNTQIAQKEAEIEKLKEKASGSTITAPVAGTVSAVNLVAGESTKPEEVLAVIQPTGKGFSLSFSATTEQAKKLSIGDMAELQNAWYYEDVKATLSSIKPDPKEPAQKKLLTFKVEGDVQAGQSLSLSVGQKSANYELVVPNSAIREDNNGKFILTVESKSSPLGNRYIATRVDVEVLAADDTHTAVSAGLYGYEYVITTATKPVEAGKQVRLTD